MFNLEELISTKKVITSYSLETGEGLFKDITNWLNIYENHLENQTKSIHTINSYLFTLNAFLEFSGKYYQDTEGLSKINEDILNDFLLWFVSYKNNSIYGTINERLKILVPYLENCVKQSNVSNDETDEIFLNIKQDILFSTPEEMIEKFNFIIDDFLDFHDLNNINISKIDNNYIKKYISYTEKNEPKSTNKTMQQRKASLTAFLSFIEEKNIDTHKFKPLFKYLHNFETEKRTTHNKKPFNDEEILIFSDFLEEYPTNFSENLQRIKANSEYVAYRDTFLILVMMHGGCRTNEVINLKFSDIKNDNEGFYEVEVTGKGNKIRKTFIKVDLIEKHLKYLSENRKNNYIASTNRGNILSRHNLFNSVKKLYHEAGLKKQGLHILRHHFASNFAEKNGNMAVLQKLLGHTKIDTTMIYAKIGEKAAKENLKGIQ